MQKIKDFIATSTGQQIYSFLKTYITVLLAIIVFADQSGVDIFTSAFIVSAVKASTISVIRNVYKAITE